MSHLVSEVFSPVGVIVALLAAAIWSWRRPHSASARRFLITVAAAYTFASVYAIPYAVSRLLCIGYGRFELAAAPSGRTAIVILGAGDLPVQGWEDRIFPMNLDAASRVLEAWRIFRLISPAWIISSGGSVDRSEPSSTNMHDALIGLGVPSNRIVLESESYNTHDEAVLIAPMLRSLHVDRVVLVTSDVHMRRSLGTFRAQGVDAVPAIAPDSRAWSPWQQWVFPTSEGLDFSREVMHELLGIPYYWARGWWRS